jgi:nucleotide-binding universal stress UspA family protein
MSKQILLPTDFSDNAWQAAMYAINLYSEENCIFYFLHASKLKVSTTAVISNKLSTIMAENNKKELKDLKERAEQFQVNSKHEFKIILSAEDLQDAVAETIKKYKTDLVVMGTKGASKTKGIFFGSNTINSIKKIKGSAVLVVPENFEFKQPEQIAFPTDFNRFYGEELEPFLQMAQWCKAHISVVHINEKENLTSVQEENLEKLKKIMNDYPHSFHWMRDYDKVEVGIKDFLEIHHIDVLAMINYRHSILENLINEPVIKKIGFQPTIPFLIVPCSSEK